MIPDFTSEQTVFAKCDWATYFKSHLFNHIEHKTELCKFFLAIKNLRYMSKLPASSEMPIMSATAAQHISVAESAKVCEPNIDSITDKKVDSSIE